MTNVADFTWIPTHNRIANYLKDKQNHQTELIELLKAAGAEGFTDKDSEGNNIPLSVMDPFTFFCYIYKYGDKKRLTILQNLATKLDLPIPKDTNGVPSVNAQKVWMFPYQYERNGDEINTLWEFFFASFDNGLSEELFAKVKSIRNVGYTKLTEALFNIKPENYLPINSQTRPYLKKVMNISPKITSLHEYESILKDIKEESTDPYYQISHEAYTWNTNRKNTSYWIFQGNPKRYDFEKAIREETIEKYSIRDFKKPPSPGDKAILTISGDKPGIYGLAEITSDPYEYEKELKVDVVIIENIAKQPILKGNMPGVDLENEFKVGIQGSSFYSNKQQYDKVKNLINSKTQNFQYWLYAPGSNAHKWEEFYEEGVMALGWSELGDLSQYESKVEIEEEFKRLLDTDVRKMNDSAANFEFLQEMEIGDYVLVKRGRRKLLGLGVVTSDYYHEEEEDSEYTQKRKVDWIKKGEWDVDHTMAVKTLTNITGHPADAEEFEFYHQQLLALMGENVERINKIKKVVNHFSSPLNNILYGPPGTGKTFSTIDKAVKIVDFDNYDPIDHAANKESFNRWVKEGKVVFTTFHQSMSYEDFIEGIKPETEEETGQLNYIIQDGLFKKICVEAATPFLEKAKTSKSQPTLTYALKFDQLLEDVEEHLSNNEFYALETKSGNEIEIVEISSQGNFIIRHKNGKAEYTISRARTERLYDAYPNVNDLDNIQTAFREVIGGMNASAYWALLNRLQSMDTQEEVKEINWAKVDYETKAKEFAKINWEKHNDFEADPYVLIIDEINRGNISAIFGELITLLEPNKRGGAEEHLTAKLPYSKTNFTVPKNLFVIGAMNTADRSVEALDTALRRRFSFEEMMPQTAVIKDVLGDKNVWNGIRISEVLATINERIEILVDRDHLIGHSYFLALKEVAPEKMEDALIHIFVDKIIPLLQEYFYNDYVKIGMVLGKGFLQIKETQRLTFADFEESLDADYTEKTIYHINGRQELKQRGLEVALQQLLNKSTEE